MKLEASNLGSRLMFKVCLWFVTSSTITCCSTQTHDYSEVCLFCVHVLVIPLLCGGCFVLWCVVLCCGVLCCGVLCCGVLRCGVLCCGVLCCGVLRCGVLCCGVLCCVLQSDAAPHEPMTVLRFFFIFAFSLSHYLVWVELCCVVLCSAIRRCFIHKPMTVLRFFLSCVCLSFILLPCAGCLG